MEDVYFYYIIIILFCVGVLYISGTGCVGVYRQLLSEKLTSYSMQLKNLCDLRRLRASDGLLLL